MSFDIGKFVIAALPPPAPNTNAVRILPVQPAGDIPQIPISSTGAEMAASSGPSVKNYIVVAAVGLIAIYFLMRK